MHSKAMDIHGFIMYLLGSIEMDRSPESMGCHDSNGRKEQPQHAKHRAKTSTPLKRLCIARRKQPIRLSFCSGMHSEFGLSYEMGCCSHAGLFEIYKTVACRRQRRRLSKWKERVSPVPGKKALRLVVCSMARTKEHHDQNVRVY